jgi:hypothetical protein
MWLREMVLEVLALVVRALEELALVEMALALAPHT